MDKTTKQIGGYPDHFQLVYNSTQKHGYSVIQDQNVDSNGVTIYWNATVYYPKVTDHLCDFFIKLFLTLFEYV